MTLRAAGAYPGILTGTGHTPLAIAVEKGHSAVCAFLLSADHPDGMQASVLAGGHIVFAFRRSPCVAARVLLKHEVVDVVFPCCSRLTLLAAATARTVLKRHRARQRWRWTQWLAATPLPRCPRCSAQPSLRETWRRWRCFSVQRNGPGCETQVMYMVVVAATALVAVPKKALPRHAWTTLFLTRTSQGSTASRRCS